MAYAVNPTKSYSTQLLYWSYQKPLAILIMFIFGIVSLSLFTPFIAKQYGQIDVTVPIMGTSVIQVPSELLGDFQGAQISIMVSGAFQWSFYLAISAAALCQATKVLHDRSSQLPRISSALGYNSSIHKVKLREP